MIIIPITFKQAKKFVNKNHSHHIAPVGWKFGVGIQEKNKLIGVGIAGRPVSRMLDDGYTIEITRCCTNASKKNIASMIYGSLARAAKALGYKRCITYTLESEKGTSLKASNWKKAKEVKGRSWNCLSRKREDKHPLCNKIRWEIILRKEYIKST